MITITNFHGMTIEDFTKEFKKSKSFRDAERWLALKMVAMKQTIPYVASMLGHDEQTIREWVSNFNEKGADGIKYKAPDGQKKTE